MKRLDPETRALPTVLGIGGLLVLMLLVSSCIGGSPAPTATPDAFAGLSDRSEQAFREGLASYGDGRYRDALTSFLQAETLSPTVDPRIEQMIERSRAELAPSPTAVPPAPTDVPATPTAVPPAMSTRAPETDLGLSYFGEVLLAVVPGHDSDAPSATQFFFQDQIGLHIQGLKAHLRLPFELRVFNAESAALIADVQSEPNPDAQLTTGASATRQTPGPSTSGGLDPLSALATLTAAGAPPSVTPAAAEVHHLSRFWDSYVWYHQGGEDPGHYRAELYANGVLTNTFDYIVTSVPIAVTPLPVLDASPGPAMTAEPVPEPALLVPPPEPAPPAPVAPAAPPPSIASTVEPTLVPIPTPTLVPTPASAYTTIVGGAAAGVDVDASRGRFYLADSTGVIWSSDSPTGQELPTLGTPFNIGDKRFPTDLAVDQSTGYLYLSTRSCSAPDPTTAAPPGCILVVNGSGGALLKSIALPGTAGDLRIDSDLGLLFVALPDLQALGEVDIRAGKVVQVIDRMPQITSLAVDPIRHTVYATHLGGQLTVLNGRSGEITSRVALTGPGLTSVATARGLAYAVNTATHELAVVEPIGQSVNVFQLSQEPAAVAASEESGAVYVLSSRANVILQIDPTDGNLLGQVLLASRSGHPTLGVGSPQTLRPRLVLDDADQTVFASLPEAGSLAAVTSDQFPALARSIPFVDIPDQASADAIPGVLRPAGAADGPTVRAQEPISQPPPTPSTGKGL